MALLKRLFEASRTRVAAAPVHVLWTGGIDSTFRVLDLAVRQRRPVVPHYMVRQTRQSHTHEIAAMAAIRAAVAANHGPAVAALIGPLDLVQEEDLPNKVEARRLYEAAQVWFTPTILRRQYIFISRFALGRPGQAFELSWQASDKTSAPILPWIVAEGDSWRLSDAAPAALDLFRPFRFPLIHRHKTQLWADARASGFGAAMEHTHFCCMPLPNGQACGTCVTCRGVIEQSMGWRIPPPPSDPCDRSYTGAEAMKGIP